MLEEDEAARRKRRHQRTLFDGAAELYDASRRAYPQEILDLVAATAGLREDSAVLEVGCGTGQLTEQLDRLGCSATQVTSLTMAQVLAG